MDVVVFVFIVLIWHFLGFGQVLSTFTCPPMDKPVSPMIISAAGVRILMRAGSFSPESKLAALITLTLCSQPGCTGSRTFSTPLRALVMVADKGMCWTGLQ